METTLRSITWMEITPTMLFPTRWPFIYIATMQDMPNSTRNGRLPKVSITNDQRLKSGMTRNRHVPFGSGGRKSNLPTDHTRVGIQVTPTHPTPQEENSRWQKGNLAL